MASIKPSSTAPNGAGAGRKGPPPFTTDPKRLTARNLTLRGLIVRAYGIDESQVTGGPAWIDSDRYEVDAAVEKPTARESMLVLLQGLLADRFQLKLHRETRLVPRYVLAVGGNGPKFGPHFHPADATPSGPSTSAKDGLRGYTMAHLAFFLSDNRDWWDSDASDGPNPPPVLDQTGLTGAYDLVLSWASRKDWLAAFERDTGLKLELRKISSGMVVVDGAARPGPN